MHERRDHAQRVQVLGAAERNGSAQREREPRDEPARRLLRDRDRDREPVHREPDAATRTTSGSMSRDDNGRVTTSAEDEQHGRPRDRRAEAPRRPSRRVA